VGQILTRLTDTWNTLSPVRKGLLTASGIGVVVLAVLVHSWSSSTTYVTLYSGLDASDSGRIVEELRARGISYELDRSGATVRVPQRQVDELRIDFAAQGLPEGGHVGFEVFGTSSFTATDFMQRLNFQRGLQGELARTIESFPAVERARVHIVVPERSLFVDDQAPATASVVLSMRPGRRLSGDEVNGVAHLVSGAVEGLEKRHITILDAGGTMLYDGASSDSDTGFGVTSTQLGLQRDFERQLEANVQSMLDRTLGASKSAVSVRATLNFDRIETERETYSTPGDNGIPRSNTSVTESYTSAGPADGGAVPGALPNVPGADQNLPGTAVGAGGDTDTNYTRSESTTNFEVDRTLTREIAATGGVQRLSVSLLLDETIPPAQAEALKESVAAAVGLEADRGDQIVVTQLAFDRTALDQAVAAFEAEAASEQLLGYARLGLPLLLLIVAFIFVRLLIRSLTRHAVQVTDVYTHPQFAPVGAGAPAMLGEATAALRALPSPEESRRTALEDSVSSMATSSPDTVAEVVQSWLRED
jgi:flagellar M-ring protein FliF